MEHNFIGTHIVADFYGIQKNLTKDSLPQLIDYIKESCDKNYIKILKYDSFIFGNGGYTLFFLLEESHISIHSYIEYRAAFVDIFTCGTLNAKGVMDDIMNFYFPKNIITKRIQRGKKFDD